MKRREKIMKCLGVLLVFCLLAWSMVLIACGDDSDDNTAEISDTGSTPVLKIGDTFTQAGTIDGYEHTIKYIVVGEDTVDGNAVYVIESNFNPPLLEVVDIATMKLDKELMFPLETSMSAEVEGGTLEMLLTYSYSITGTPYYPMKVGNETTVVITETSTTSMMGETETETDTIIDVSWESEEVKHFDVKTLDKETDDVMELISYSLK